jgi:hypothetical protein
MPTVLSQGFWDEHGLCCSNAHSKSHGTFPCPASEVYLSPFCSPLPEGPISLYTLEHAHNKYNSKYTMKSATRCTCLSFCAKKRRKVTMWLQEEEYSEWVTGLHWIYTCGKGLYKSKVSPKVSTKGFTVRFCSEWTKDALSKLLQEYYIACHQSVTLLGHTLCNFQSSKVEVEQHDP